MRKSIPLKEAFYLKQDKSLRTSFLSDVELQSYDGNINRILYDIHNILKIRHKITETENIFNSKIFGIKPPKFPPPCPTGIWGWFAVHRFIIDYDNFKLEDFRIEYKGKNLVKDFNLVKIEGTDYQLLEATTLDFPTVKLRFRDRLPKVDLVFKGKNKTITIDELQVLPSNNSLLDKVVGESDAPV